MAVKKLGSGINRLMEIIGVAIFILLILATSLQVISRYVFNSSISWTDELSRYCFVWASLVGTSVACYRGANAAVDVLVQKFKGKIKTVHSTLVYLIIMYVAIVLIIKGFDAVRMVHSQTSTAMHIPMSIIYAALPVNMIVVAVQSFLSIIGLYISDNEPATE